LDEIVHLTIQLVHDGWDIEASSIWLLDPKSQVLKVLANVGTASDVLKQYEVPLGVGFVGYVTKTGKRIYTNDVASHPRHYRVLDDLTSFTTQSLLCVPLMSGGKIVGAMELLNKTGGFDDADVERAMSIGSAVAIAVTNAQLYKEAEARKQHLEATLEHNTSPILITDADDNLHLLNQVARTRLGLTNEAIGKPVLEVMEPPVLGVILTQPVSKLKNLPLYERITLPDGSVWVPRVAPIPEHGRILILQDITALQELEEAKDLFVATVSHDMRAPLNAIVGFAQNLSYMGPLNEEQEIFVTHILSSADRMTNMVTGLLELAKVNTHWQQQKHPCDISEIIKDVIHDFEGIALAKHMKLELNMDDGLHFVEGDATQLRSAVSNLIDNALKYSTANHTITTVAKNEDKAVLISVTDQGIGIPAEQQVHIFEMFYRAAPSAASGVGLGLALVKSIAKSHQGQVWVESEEGEGSTFYLKLPTVLPEEE
jgi:two-component system sensor histidine kinase VicK